MPREQEEIKVPFKQWIELTDGDAEQIKYQVLKGKIETRKGDGTVPVNGKRGWLLRYGQGEEKPVAEIATGAGKRLWAYGLTHPYSIVIVDHA